MGHNWLQVWRSGCGANSVPREQADCSGEGYGTLVCVGVAIRMPMSPQREHVLGQGRRTVFGNLVVK
jgi:hypothetical protein